MKHPIRKQIRRIKEEHVEDGRKRQNMRNKVERSDERWVKNIHTNSRMKIKIVEEEDELKSKDEMRY